MCACVTFSEQLATHPFFFLSKRKTKSFLSFLAFLLVNPSLTLSRQMLRQYANVLNLHSSRSQLEKVSDEKTGKSYLSDIAIYKELTHPRQPT